MSIGQGNHKTKDQLPWAPIGAPLWEWLFRIAALIVFGGAIALRLWGIDFGLPNLYHEDEWRVVLRALSFGRGSFDPGSFELGTLGMYVCFLLYAAYAGLGLVAGWLSSLDDFAVSFFVDPSPFYLIARGFFLLCGMASIYLVFLITKRIGGRWAGLVAASIMAVFPDHVFRSHLAYPDTLMLCLMAGALYVMVRNGETGTWYRKDLLAGLLIGLAGAAKYTAVFAVPAYVIWRVVEGYVSKWRWSSIAKSLSVGGLACAFGFFVGRPYFFLDLPSASGRVRGFESTQAVVGYESVSAYEEQLENLLSSGNIGVPATVAGVIGLVLLFRRWPAYGAGLMGMGGANLLWALRRERLMIRWVFPLELVLCIGAGYLVVWLYARLRKRVLVSWAAVSMCIVTALLLAVPFTNLIAQNQRISGPDTRTRARQWLEDNVPSDTKILLVGVRAYGPQPCLNRASAERCLNLVKEKGEGRYKGLRTYSRFQVLAAAKMSGPKYYVQRLKHWGAAPVYDINVPLETYVRSGTQYVVTNSWTRKNVRSNREPARRFYRLLPQYCTLASVFEPGDRVSGPVVRIWRVQANLADQ